MVHFSQPLAWGESNVLRRIEHSHKKKKIIGYMTVRNEAIIIEQAVRCFFNFIDELVILDDASADETLTILKRLALELPITEIICNAASSRSVGCESDNHKKLLAAARRTKGTHFICLDADEVFTSNCLVNDYLKQQILKLKPGESIILPLINLWDTTTTYRIDPEFKDFKCLAIFCDTKKAHFNTVPLHNPRVPQLRGKVYTLPAQYGILHYSFCSRENHSLKRAWYRCLELVRGWYTAEIINMRYRLDWTAPHVELATIPSEWISSYKIFDSNLYALPVDWRKEEVLFWFKERGRDFFKGLDIWDIDWNE